MSVTNEDIKKLIEGMAGDLKSVKESNNEILVEVKGYREEVLQLRSENEYLKLKVGRIERELFYLTNMERAKNLLIFNLKLGNFNGAELIDKICDLFDKTETPLKKEDIEKVELLNSKSATRPIKIMFYKANSKKMAFQNSKKFKEMDIWIANDLSKRHREEKKKS